MARVVVGLRGFLLVVDCSAARQIFDRFDRPFGRRDDADLASDRCRRESKVAGDCVRAVVPVVSLRPRWRASRWTTTRTHEEADARHPALFDRLARVVLGRVDKRDEPDDGQVRDEHEQLVLVRADQLGGVSGRDGPLGEEKDALTERGVARLEGDEGGSGLGGESVEGAVGA